MLQKVYTYLMGDGIILFLASFLIWLMFAGLMVLWLVDGKIKKEQVIHALFACFLTWTATQILKSFFGTERPFQIDGINALTLTTPLDPAFPSSHAAVSFALAVTIWLHDKKVGMVFLILATLVGVSRIAANVHYPADIVAGAVIGTIVAILIKKTHVRSY